MHFSQSSSKFEIITLFFSLFSLNGFEMCLIPHIYFYYFNKMNTLSEDQYIRAEKMKKQELYRNMLDQQVRYNQIKRQNQIQSLRHPLNDGRSMQQPRHSVQYPAQENKYLPPLAYQQPKEHNWSSNRNAYGRSNTEEDKTELYLNNCEEIIRNLRELKGKKKQWENYSSQPQYNPKKQMQREKYQHQQVQYYPKPNYFSSSGSAYNKNVGNDISTRQYKPQSNRMSTLQQPRHGYEKYPKKQSTSKNLKNGKYLDKINHPTAETEGKQFSRSKSSDKNQMLQSESPLGIKQQHRIPKKSSKVRHKLFKLSTAKKQGDSRVYTEPRQFEQNQRNSSSKQQINKNQSELVACLSELTKYLKNLNEKQEKDQKKSQDQQVDNNPSQIEQKQAQNNQQQQQKEKPKQKRQPQQQHLSHLKQKVIEALKNASQKSHSLFMKMSDRSAVKSPSLLKEGQKQAQNRNNEKNDQQNKVGPQGRKNRRSQTQEFARLLSSHLERLDGSNEQLNNCLKELHEYLKNQNEEIKELKTYRDSQMMKQKESSPPKAKSPIQNRKQASRSPSQAQENTKSFRSPSPVQASKSLRSPSPTQDRKQTMRSKSPTQNDKRISRSVSPVQKQQQKSPQKNQSSIQRNNSPNAQRRKQAKLQEAILKNLKKARLRGSKFKERVESYKKAHQPQQNNQDNPQGQEKPQQQQTNANQPKKDEPEKPKEQVKPATNEPKIQPKVQQKPQQTLQQKIEQKVEQKVQQKVENNVQTAAPKKQGV